MGKNITFTKGANPLKKTLQRGMFTGESPNNDFKTLRYSRVVYNSKLKRRYCGRISSNGFCFRDDRRCGACSFGEINKNTKRKRNFGSGLQGRIEDGTECFRRYLENDKEVVLSNSD